MRLRIIIDLLTSYQTVTCNDGSKFMHMCPPQTTAGAAAPKTTAPTINTQPAIMKPTEEPPAYSQSHTQVRLTTTRPHVAKNTVCHADCVCMCLNKQAECDISNDLGQHQQQRL